MRKIFLSSKQIYQVDKLATERFLIPSIILMENAGRSVAEFVSQVAKKRNFNNIIIFCGPGKNGGDGFVCARYLSIWGFKIKVVTFVDEDVYKGDTLLNYKILKKLKVKIEKFHPVKIKPLVRNCDIIVDAIFGIGLSREVKGEFEQAIKIINDSKKTVVAVDIPSGINADNGKVMGCAVKSDYTITMGFMKTGFMNNYAKKFLGKIIVVDIGYPNVITKFVH